MSDNEFARQIELDSSDCNAEKQFFIEEITEFLEVCEYNNRTLEENLDMLIADNPGDDEYFIRIYKGAKARKA